MFIDYDLRSLEPGHPLKYIFDQAHNIWRIPDAPGFQEYMTGDHIPTMFAKPRKYYTFDELESFRRANLLRNHGDPKVIRRHIFTENRPYMAKWNLYDKDLASYTFYDKYKGFDRFNIVCHGVVRNYGDGMTGQVLVEGALHGPEMVVRIAEQAAREKDFRCMNLLICNSGEGGSRSLISNVSRMMRKPVKGYRGGVRTYTPSDARYDPIASFDFAARRRLGRGYAVDPLAENPSLFARSGETVMAGFEYFWV